MRIFIAVILSVLSLSSALGWSIQGAVEPDTARDRQDGRMPLAPDVDPNPAVGVVYFNAVVQQTSQYSTTPQGARVNQNLLGSRIAPVGSAEALAYLGLWKDCNADGYAGDALTASLVYREELLSSSAICPRGSIHHNGSWVREFVWIHPTAPASAAGYHDFIVDTEAAVWGDFKLPEDDAREACSFTTFARGTFSRTGGVLRHLDCQTRYRTADTLAAGGLGFEDAYHPERDCDHPLNRPVGVYNDTNRCEGERVGLLEDRAPRAASAYDCETTLIAPRDPTAPPEHGNGLLTQTPGGRYEIIPGSPLQLQSMPIGDNDGNFARVPAPGPAVDPEGSGYTATHGLFYETLTLCATTYAPWPAYIPLWFGSVEHIQTLNPSRQETGANARAPGEGKRESDFSFIFSPAVSSRQTGSAGAAGPTPYYGGHSVTDAMLGLAWRSAGGVRTLPAYTGLQIRNDLSVDDAAYLTFYARVGATKARASVPADATYGAERCGGAVAGVVGGWDCDASHWWSMEHGSAPPPAGATMPRPGWSYQLRDIDCFDATIHEGLPARASPGEVTGEVPCEP